MSKSNIPESLRQQLVKAGKARARTLTDEARRQGGLKSWANRLKRAKDAEALARRQAQPRNIAPPTKGIF